MLGDHGRRSGTWIRLFEMSYVALRENAPGNRFFVVHSSYMGQTSRQLKTRTHEHQLAVKYQDPKSLISAHTGTKQHQFDWSDTKIISHTTTAMHMCSLKPDNSTSHSINGHINLQPAYIALQDPNPQHSQPEMAPTFNHPMPAPPTSTSSPSDADLI